ncbi:hypothetical protein MMC24_006423 [Lignoscripta atroalba]|nr:hypothetical protein [Lignoscripta atroalba]
MSVAANSLLIHRLAEALPLGLRFCIHHLSSPPTLCPALFSAPPNQRAEITHCESHFLSVSIPINERTCQVFAIEVLIYTTATLTTLFVSKADSTGYLHLIPLPEGTSSPLRALITTFISYLVESRQRPGIRVVLSLFARAQDQYLFPGSIENSAKHVLDDRGLIRWWCRVLDPVLRDYPAESDHKSSDAEARQSDDNRLRSRGYLKVPGCDIYETKAFFPDTVKKESREDARWRSDDPLLKLGKPPSVPERCLIPRFPDDPKARFVLDLDDELSDNASQVQESPSKNTNPGKWRSVKSLEQFWEMMAFRQECAAGRLVGFIWGVFTPPELLGRSFVTSAESNREKMNGTLPTPLPSQVHDDAIIPPESPMRSSPVSDLPHSPFPSSQVQPLESPAPTPKPEKERRLNSPDIAYAPCINDVTVSSKTQQPEFSEYYLWAVSSQGEVVLPEQEYNEVNELLLSLDYADENIAALSTKKWIEHVSKLAGGREWGQVVIGTKVTPIKAKGSSGISPTTLDTGLVRKRTRESVDQNDSTATLQGSQNGTGINILATGVVRKKPKVNPVLADAVTTDGLNNGINILSANLIKKKVKP